MNFYNDIEAYPAAWLENLIAAGQLPKGDVSTQDIKEIEASAITGYDQCHFFAGIGGWPYALKLAGLETTRSVWTGSCPCQPFSIAGKGKGENDERHLWPVFAKLIDECKPWLVFGEQVASPSGRDWLSRVRLDLEGMGYAVGAADLCAAGVGAPHIRQRLFWGAVRVENAMCCGSRDKNRAVTNERRESLDTGRKSVSQRDGGVGANRFDTRSINTFGAGAPCRIPDANHAGPQKQRRGVSVQEKHAFSTFGGHWDEYELFEFGDGKTRRIKPGIVPVVDGLPGSVGHVRPYERRGQIKGYGNAIVPQVAAIFALAFMEPIDILT